MTMKFRQEVSKMVHNLKDLEFRKSVNGYDYIVVPSSLTRGILPEYVQVQSHKTGKLVRFNHINPEHPRYDVFDFRVSRHCDGPKETLVG